MLKMKRLYDPDEAAAYREKISKEAMRLIQREGVPLDQAKARAEQRIGRPAVTGVVIKEAGDDQHFTERVISQGMTEGWLAIDGDSITINAENGPVRYKIINPPGYYCCFCNASLPFQINERTGQPDCPAGREHVAKSHAGQKSPNPNNPAGYRRDAHYTCAKEG